MGRYGGFLQGYIEQKQLWKEIWNFLIWFFTLELLGSDSDPMWKAKRCLWITLIYSKLLVLIILLDADS